VFIHSHSHDHYSLLYCTGSMPFSTHKVMTTLEGSMHTVRVARLTFVGELGYEIHVEAGAAMSEVYASLFETAEQLGLPLVRYNTTRHDSQA
jgi:glycine cleavage system aminomethyltransferase T